MSKTSTLLCTGVLALLAGCGDPELPTVPPPAPPPPRPTPVATELRFDVNPVAGITDSVLSPVVVTARDPSGFLDARFADSVTISLVAGGPSTALEGTTTVAATAGVAVFTDLRIGGPGWEYRLEASTRALQAATSRAFEIRDPAPRLAFAGCLSWSEDATHNDVCLATGLTILRLDGSGRDLTVQDLDELEEPAWSPDGSRIAFTGYASCRYDIGPACVPAIFTMRPDGTGVTRLTTVQAGIIAEYGAAWSPDGSRLAFHAWDTNAGGSGSPRLEIMNADGSGRIPLGNLRGWDPAWSPDGRRIAYTAQDESGRQAIHLAQADGTGASRLTDPASLPGDPARDFRPAWSPDGRRIAFTRAWQHPQGNGSCQVLVMDTAGGNASQLTQDEFCAQAPAWSPDGTRIAYKGYEGRQPWIKLMNPDGSGTVLLRRMLADFSRITWAPR